MGYSERRQSVAKPLQSPDEIRMMKSDQAIIISDNKPPIKIKMPWFSDVPSLNKLTKKNPAYLNFDYSNDEFKKMIERLSLRITLPPVSVMFLPPFFLDGQHKGPVSKQNIFWNRLSGFFNYHCPVILCFFLF